MKHSERYFCNKDCKYYPCHSGMEGKDFNCLFCFCPLYARNHCPGTPQYIKLESGNAIKDCSACTYVHQPENYDTIIQFLSHPEKK